MRISGTQGRKRVIKLVVRSSHLGLLKENIVTGFWVNSEDKTDF